MPNYVTRIDRDETTRERGDEVTLTPQMVLQVRAIRIRHGEVSLIDPAGRESVLIQHGMHPGAGMSVDVADHVKLTDG